TDLQVQFLHASRHAHRPPAVAEVALELADDRRHREGRELSTAFGLETVAGVHDADECDLLELVERLAAEGEAAGQGPSQADMGLEQLIAQARVARGRVFDEHCVDLAAVAFRNRAAIHHRSSITGACFVMVKCTPSRRSWSSNSSTVTARSVCARFPSSMDRSDASPRTCPSTETPSVAWIRSERRSADGTRANTAKHTSSSARHTSSRVVTSQTQ